MGGCVDSWGWRDQGRSKNRVKWSLKDCVSLNGTLNSRSTSVLALRFDNCSVALSYHSLKPMTWCSEIVAENRCQNTGPVFSVCFMNIWHHFIDMGPNRSACRWKFHGVSCWLTWYVPVKILLVSCGSCAVFSVIFPPLFCRFTAGFYCTTVPDWLCYACLGHRQ